MANTKLTSVKILKILYERFKVSTVNSNMTLQKLTNRAIDLYLESDEFKSFLIYDTKEFLKVINCFNNPKVIINDDLITLQEFNNEFRYHTAEKSMMVLPEKTIDETISNQTPETQFELSFDDIKELQRVNDILKLPHLIIKPDEDNCHSLTYTDIHNKKSEDDFVGDGYGARRYNLMYNDFVIVGPMNNNDNCNSIKSATNIELPANFV